MTEPAQTAGGQARDEVSETFAREFIRAREAADTAAIRRILVPTDFSGCSAHALRWAEVLAQRFGAELVLLHVDELLLVLCGSDLGADAQAAGVPQLNRAVALLGACGFRARDVLRAGEAVREIVRTAGEEGADVIVMGTHGRRGVSHAFLGSVAERVVRRAGCPVLTIRHPEGNVSTGTSGVEANTSRKT